GPWPTGACASCGAARFMSEVMPTSEPGFGVGPEVRPTSDDCPLIWISTRSSMAVPDGVVEGGSSPSSNSSDDPSGRTGISSSDRAPEGLPVAGISPKSNSPDDPPAGLATGGASPRWKSADEDSASLAPAAGG